MTIVQIMGCSFLENGKIEVWAGGGGEPPRLSAGRCKRQLKLGKVR
jgi:hypothetical protein